MGLFKRSKTTPTVRVVPGHPGYPPPTLAAHNTFQGYTYRWDLPESPAVGTWLVVPGDPRQWVAAVVAVEEMPAKDAAGLKAVVRVATKSDIAKDIRRRSS